MTTDAVIPTPTRETRSSSTLRRNVCAPGSAPAAPMMPTTNLKQVRLGLRGQLSGWAATEIALAVDPRLAPMRVGPPSSEEVRPETILAERSGRPDRVIRPDLVLCQMTDWCRRSRRDQSSWDTMMTL